VGIGAGVEEDSFIEAVGGGQYYKNIEVCKVSSKKIYALHYDDDNFTFNVSIVQHSPAVCLDPPQRNK
jgi:hypothetical protein